MLSGCGEALGSPDCTRRLYSVLLGFYELGRMVWGVGVIGVTVTTWTYSIWGLRSAIGRGNWDITFSFLFWYGSTGLCPYTIFSSRHHFSLFLERWEGFFVSFRSFDFFVILEGGIRKGEGGLFSFSQALHTRYLLR